MGLNFSAGGVCGCAGVGKEKFDLMTGGGGDKNRSLEACFFSAFNPLTFKNIMGTKVLTGNLLNHAIAYVCGISFAKWD